jgi:hypothetical protein
MENSVWTGPKPVSRLHKTDTNRTQPVDIGFVWSFPVHQPITTGLGLGLSKFGRKTGPDRTFKHYKYLFKKHHHVLAWLQPR